MEYFKDDSKVAILIDISEFSIVLEEFQRDTNNYFINLEMIISFILHYWFELNFVGLSIPELENECLINNYLIHSRFQPIISDFVRRISVLNLYKDYKDIYYTEVLEDFYILKINIKE